MGWKATDVTEVSAYYFLMKRNKGGGEWQKQRERWKREGGRAGVCVHMYVCVRVCACKCTCVHACVWVAK